MTLKKAELETFLLNGTSGEGIIAFFSPKDPEVEGKPPHRGLGEEGS